MTNIEAARHLIRLKWSPHHVAWLLDLKFEIVKRIWKEEHERGGGAFPPRKPKT